jgi:hypothetical protein
MMKHWDWRTTVSLSNLTVAVVGAYGGRREKGETFLLESAASAASSDFLFFIFVKQIKYCRYHEDESPIHGGVCGLLFSLSLSLSPPTDAFLRYRDLREYTRYPVDDSLRERVPGYLHVLACTRVRVLYW